MYALTIPIFERQVLSNVIDKQVPFAATLAHEIRNPLSNIILSVEALKNAEKDFDPNIWLDIIMRSSIRINGLVNELVVCQPGKADFCGEQSIHQLIDEAVTMAGDRITLKNISVLKDYSILNYAMVLDKGKMKIALANIIINAIESMPVGKGLLKLITKSIGDQFVLRIEDNGCGISEENLKKMFNSWFSDKPGGMGIGLTTSYEILLSNHIGMNVVSAKGIGIKFILCFDKNLQGRFRKPKSSQTRGLNKSLFSVVAADEEIQHENTLNVLALPGGTGPLREFRRQNRRKTRLVGREKGAVMHG